MREQICRQKWKARGRVKWTCAFAVLCVLVSASLVGCGDDADDVGSEAAGDSTIVLGAAISQTGKYSTSGKHTKNGYELAVRLVNDAGGVEIDGKKYDLVVKYYDDESTPARAAQLIERLVRKDNVHFLLGPYSSPLTKAIAPVAEKHGIPMVQANGAARDLFEQEYRYMFGVLSTAEQYFSPVVDLLARQAEENGNDPGDMRVAVIVENDNFSLDIRAGVLERVKHYGMKIVVDEKLPAEVNDMSAALTKVKKLRPDLLVVSGHARGAGLAVRQVANRKLGVPMVALTHCDSADVINKEQFGDKAEGIYCAVQWAPEMPYEDKFFGTATDYSHLFEEKYGYVPPYQAAESSAAVMVFVDAFKRAGTLDPKAVRDALADTDLPTFYGHVKFDETGKNIAKPMVLLQVRDGKYEIAFFPEEAEAEIP